MDLLNDAIDKLHAMRLRDEDDVTAKACEDIAERSGKIKDLLDLSLIHISEPTRPY